MKKVDILRNLREDHALTQKQVGEILHTSQRSYDNYEAGTREIPLETLIKLADFYDVCLDHITEKSTKKN